MVIGVGHLCCYLHDIHTNFSYFDYFKCSPVSCHPSLLVNFVDGVIYSMMHCADVCIFILTLERSHLTFYLGLRCTKIVLQAQVGARVNTAVRLSLQFLLSILVICPYSYNTCFLRSNTIYFSCPLYPTKDHFDR